MVTVTAWPEAVGAARSPVGAQAWGVCPGTTDATQIVMSCGRSSGAAPPATHLITSAHHFCGGIAAAEQSVRGGAERQRGRQPCTVRAAPSGPIPRHTRPEVNDARSKQHMGTTKPNSTSARAMPLRVPSSRADYRQSLVFQVPGGPVPPIGHPASDNRRFTSSYAPCVRRSRPRRLSPIACRAARSRRCRP